MSTVTTSPDISVEHAPSRLTSTLLRSTVSVGVLAAAVSTAGAVALRAAGVPLAVLSPATFMGPPSGVFCHEDGTTGLSVMGPPGVSSGGS